MRKKEAPPAPVQGAQPGKRVSSLCGTHAGASAPSAHTSNLCVCWGVCVCVCVFRGSYPIIYQNLLVRYMFT